MTEYFIGIDAGGTRCRASLYDLNGTLQGSGTAGAANVYSDFRGAMTQIDCAISNAIVNSALPINKDNLVVGAGCAGGQTSQAKERLKEWQVPYKHLFMTSDLHASCLAANAGKDCIVIITGTGSSIAHYHSGNVTQFGGHGFIHGDDASGAWLGLKAVQLLLKSVDNLVSDTYFCDQIFEFINDLPNAAENKSIGQSADEILGYFKQKNAADYAVLAPIIAELKNTGNKTATLLIEQGLDYLYSVLAANHLLNKSDIFMTGGLAPVYRNALANKVGQKIEIMQHPAEYGACLFAQSMFHHLRNISV